MIRDWKVTRLLRLLYWGLCYLVPGGQTLRLRRGPFLREFNHFWQHRSPGGEYQEPFRTYRDWEAYRQERARIFLESKVHMPMPKTPAQAAALWGHRICTNHLFAFIARREAHPLRFLRWMRWLPWQGRILEYGAGAAPLAFGLDLAWPFPRPHLVVADIHWVLLDYVKVRFAGRPWLTVHSLHPEHPWAESVYDAIVCTETLEHVPDPLKTAQGLVHILKPGGRLLYDYAPQPGDQPLAPRGLSARKVTLRWLELNTKHLAGPTRQGLYVVEKI